MRAYPSLSRNAGSRLTSLSHEPEQYPMFYVDLEGVKAAPEKATELGGKPLLGPITIPAGTFAWFSGPAGNAIASVAAAAGPPVKERSGRRA